MSKPYAFYISLYFIAGAICLTIGMFGYDLVGFLPSPTKETIRNTLQVNRIANPYEENDILDADKLIGAITSGDGYLPKLIRAKLSKQAFDLISDTALSDVHSRKEHLVVELNRMARSGMLLEIEAFRRYRTGPVNVPDFHNPSELSEATKFTLTRMLLVAAFPGLVRNGYFYRWDYWNLAAVLMTFLFSLLFWADRYVNNGPPPMFSEMRLSAQALINILFAVALVCLGFAFDATLRHNIEGKLIFTAVFFLSWLVIDLVMMRAHRLQAIRDEFWDLFCYIDLTFLVTISIMILFYYLNREELMTRTDFPTFLTGAFAFKVILQNTNFLVVIIRSQR